MGIMTMAKCGPWLYRYLLWLHYLLYTWWPALHW